MFTRRHRQRTILSAATVAGLEQLEKRVLFSTINWTNKGTSTVDSDGFNAIYGANATLARTIAQRAIDDWERVIVNFNGSGGRNSFSLTLSAAPLGPNTFGSTGSITLDALSKPQAASTTLDDDAAGAGWYFDPTPGTATLPDDSDFTAFVTPFEADRPVSSGRDFYRTALHEIGHAMGIAGVSPLLTSLETDVGDDPNSSNVADRLMAVDVNGDNVADYTLTTNGGRHLFEGGGTYTGPVHPNDLDNPGRTVSNAQVRRGLITDTDATLLRDVYGYTITMPSTINTFYVQYNQGANSVTVNGDMNPSGSLRDVIDLETSGTAMRFEVNGTSETIEGANFAGIVVNAGDGNDDIDVDNVLASKSVIVNGENGNDFIQLAPQTGDIGNDILSNLTVNGGSGTDTIQANDTSDPVGSDTYTITSPSITFGSRVMSYSLTESIDLLGSRNATTYNINSTVPGCTISILASGFGDDFFVGDGDYDSHIFGDVDIDGQNGADFLHIEDSSDAGAGNYTISSTSFSKTSGGGTLSLDSIERTFIEGSNQANTYTVDLFSSGMTVDIDAGPGNDTLDVSGTDNDIDNNMAADITFDGQAGTDKLDLDDSGDSADPESYELTGTTFTKSSAGGTLSFDKTEDIDLRANNGNNTITVQFGNIVDTENVTVGGGGGDDVITSLVPGTISLLRGNVTLQGGAGADSIILDDSIGSLTDTYNLATDTLDMSGPGFATGVINYTAESFDLTTDVFDADIKVSGTAAGTSYVVRGGDGNDTFDIGAGGNADAIDGALTIRGDGGADAFNYRDGSNTAGHTYTVTSTTLARDGAATVTYAGMESLDVEGGTQADTVNLNSSLASAPVTLNGNGGADTFTVGGGDWDDNLLSDVTIDGGGGTSDTVRIDDTSDAIAPADNYTVTSAQTTKSSTGVSINYTTVEGYTLDASGSANVITVNSSFAAPFRVNGNGGADAVNLVSSAAGSFVTIDGGAGLDTVNVNSDGLGTAVAHFDATQDLAALNVLAGGTALMEANGARVIDTDALTIASAGKLDLTDNDMIVDYTAATQLGVVQALLNIGRNNGAWNGNGITSSTAGANASHNTTLGAMESSDFKSIYGAAATFDGRAIDNTAVIVKYTYYGDADFNGKVNFDDYVRTDNGFNNHRTGWTNGDYDGNGQVNFDDYVMIDLAFNTQSGVL